MFCIVVLFVFSYIHVGKFKNKHPVHIQANKSRTKKKQIGDIKDFLESHCLCD